MGKGIEEMLMLPKKKNFFFKAQGQLDMGA